STIPDEATALKHFKEFTPQYNSVNKQSSINNTDNIRTLLSTIEEKMVEISNKNFDISAQPNPPQTYTQSSSTRSSASGPTSQGQPRAETSTRLRPIPGLNMDIVNNAPLESTTPTPRTVVPETNLTSPETNPITVGNALENAAFSLINFDAPNDMFGSLLNDPRIQNISISEEDSIIVTDVNNNTTKVDFDNQSIGNYTKLKNAIKVYTALPGSTLGLNLNQLDSAQYQELLRKIKHELQQEIDKTIEVVNENTLIRRVVSNIAAKDFIITSMSSVLNGYVIQYMKDNIPASIKIQDLKISEKEFFDRLNEELISGNVLEITDFTTLKKKELAASDSTSDLQATQNQTTTTPAAPIQRPKLKPNINRFVKIPSEDQSFEFLSFQKNPFQKFFENNPNSTIDLTYFENENSVISIDGEEFTITDEQKKVFATFFESLRSSFDNSFFSSINKKQYEDFVQKLDENAEAKTLDELNLKLKNLLERNNKKGITKVSFINGNAIITMIGSNENDLTEQEIQNLSDFEALQLELLAYSLNNKFQKALKWNESKKSFVETYMFDTINSKALFAFNTSSSISPLGSLFEILPDGEVDLSLLNESLNIVKINGVEFNLESAVEKYDAIEKLNRLNNIRESLLEIKSEIEVLKKDNYKSFLEKQLKKEKGLNFPTSVIDLLDGLTKTNRENSLFGKDNCLEAYDPNSIEIKVEESSGKFTLTVFASINSMKSLRILQTLKTYIDIDPSSSTEIQQYNYLFQQSSINFTLSNLEQMRVKKTQKENPNFGSDLKNNITRNLENNSILDSINDVISETGLDTKFITLQTEFRDDNLFNLKIFSHGVEIARLFGTDIPQRLNPEILTIKNAQMNLDRFDRVLLDKKVLHTGTIENYSALIKSFSLVEEFKNFSFEEIAEFKNALTQIIDSNNANSGIFYFKQDGKIELRTLDNAENKTSDYPAHLNQNLLNFIQKYKLCIKFLKDEGVVSMYLIDPKTEVSINSPSYYKTEIANEMYRQFQEENPSSGRLIPKVSNFTESTPL
ncbi:MAG: hypothetical protein ACRCXZ_07435, partial [Patescibacteria group bacterium]